MLDYSMKHAYLIMAHHEFEVLGKLVQALMMNEMISIFILIKR